MMLFLPELALLGAALIFFTLTLKTPDRQTLHTTALLSTTTVFLISLFTLGAQGSLFFDAYKISYFSQLFKAMLLGSALIVLITAREIPGIKEKIAAEYYMFFFIAILGLVMLVSSVELIAILVALELSSFTTYIMVAMRNDSIKSLNHNEAAIKYLLYGVMATGFMLFGMSYIYGLTGTTRLDMLAVKMGSLMTQPVAIVSFILLLAGTFYKLALFPFQLWVPDVYEGASDETTAFIATLPKLGAVAIFIQFAMLPGINTSVLPAILILCAITSMFYGNLSALVQKDIKRLLGFSGIAHGGFILLGILLFDRSGYTNAIYYSAGYVLMNFTCFLTIVILANGGKNLKTEDFIGLHQRNPLLATTFTVGLFALAGIPPFIGFTGKFMLLADALNAGFFIPVILAAINTALALYYYLSIVRLAYCTNDEDTTVEPIQISNGQKGLCLFLITSIIMLGVFPDKFLAAIETALLSL